MSRARHAKRLAQDHWPSLWQLHDPLNIDPAIIHRVMGLDYCNPQFTFGN